MAKLEWTPAYIGVGSNLDDPALQVRHGLDALEDLPKTKLIARSQLYRSPPLGPQDQPDYVNAAAGVLTLLDSRALLEELKALESKLGRGAPVVRWGPRKIDFDLLVFGSERCSDDALRIPHPGVGERAFVLVPLAEFAPHLEVPGVGRVEMLVRRVDRGSVVPL